MLLNDKQITQLCQSDNPLISPFCPQLISKENNVKRISYGVSSFGYDCRLSPKDFKIFRNSFAVAALFDSRNYPIDPKSFSRHFLETVGLNLTEQGDYFLIPPFGYGLGLTVERFHISNDITGIALGKSTYARAGLIVNTTPLESGWTGQLVVEMYNSTIFPLKVYANEGIIQVLFYQGEECLVSYADRQGKYQDQNGIVLAKV